jgi:hypothetical protein
LKDQNHLFETQKIVIFYSLKSHFLKKLLKPNPIRELIIVIKPDMRIDPVKELGYTDQFRKIKKNI